MTHGVASRAGARPREAGATPIDTRPCRRGRDTGRDHRRRDRHRCAHGLRVRRGRVDNDTALFTRARIFDGDWSPVSVTDPGVTLSGDRPLTGRSERVQVANTSEASARIVFARLSWPGCELVLDDTPTTFRYSPALVGLGVRGLAVTSAFARQFRGPEPADLVAQEPTAQ